MRSIVAAAIIAAALTTAGCSASAPITPPTSETPAASPSASAPAATLKPTATPKPVPTLDSVAQAITDRYGDCLIKLGFTAPFGISVYTATHKADVSGAPGVVGFLTATSDTGNLLTMPDESDNSARALASVGCG